MNHREQREAVLGAAKPVVSSDLVAIVKQLPNVMPVHRATHDQLPAQSEVPATTGIVTTVDATTGRPRLRAVGRPNVTWTPAPLVLSEETARNAVTGELPAKFLPAVAMRKKFRIVTAMTGTVDRVPVPAGMNGPAHVLAGRQLKDAVKAHALVELPGKGPAGRNRTGLPREAGEVLNPRMRNRMIVRAGRFKPLKFRLGNMQSRC